MKKNLVLLALICFGVAPFCSCGEDMDYKKACEQKDFSTAYAIVDKLKEKANQARIEAIEETGHRDRDERARITQEEYEEAEKYVILQETIHLIETEGTNSLMRIIGIGKEHNAEYWLYTELLDIAKKMGDKDLANGIETIIQSNSDTNKVIEEDKSEEEIEKTTPMQPTPKKKTGSKRRRR